jgi:hypothetical protein
MKTEIVNSYSSEERIADSAFVEGHDKIICSFLFGENKSAMIVVPQE